MVFTETGGVLHALDARTHAEFWRHRDRYGPYRGSAYAADGRTFVAVQFFARPESPVHSYSRRRRRSAARASTHLHHDVESGASASAFARSHFTASSTLFGASLKVGA